MIGSRVRHAGGVGKVAALGHEGVTLESGERLRHGEYELHNDAEDIATVSWGYERLAEALPDLVRLSPRRRVGIVAALALVTVRGALGQTLEDRRQVDRRAKALLQAAKGRDGHARARLRDGTEVHVDAGDVEAFLQRYGLSLAALRRWGATVVYVLARDAGQTDREAEETVRARCGKGGSTPVIDPVVRAGYDAAGISGSIGERIRRMARRHDVRDHPAQVHQGARGPARSVRGPEAEAGGASSGQRGASTGRGAEAGDGASRDAEAGAAG